MLRTCTGGIDLEDLDLDPALVDIDSTAGGELAEPLAWTIAVEADCSIEKANEVIFFLRMIVDHSRYEGYKPHHLSDWELLVVHDVLDIIMPDDQVGQPGSAHDRLNRELLDSRRGEAAFLHHKVGPVVQDCAVTIQVYRGS